VLYKRALAIFEQKAKGYGRDFIVTDTGLDTTPEVARVVDVLAALYERQGKYEAAEPLYKQALQIWNTRMWGKTPEFAGRLVKLARVYEAEGKRDQAKPLIAQALSLYGSYFRPGNANGIFFDSPEALGDYALLLTQSNQTTKAAEVRSRIKAIQEKQSKVVQ
jgi:tetratricopeptide (TPR) repeat protein